MAKTIMLQGTMSNVGKSLLTAALCRIFSEDGYKVAPFKSQNMALNSYITSENLEIGRAQAMQSEAAGVEPSAYMNPVLLKPTTDVGSQVIVMGKSIGNMSAKQYFAYKKSLVPKITDAFNHLAASHDIVVIEGAGSPAEINLKSEDIVNMGMAKIAQSPVLLIGDIDRGGIFAQLYGTLHLLENEEAKYIKGLIINKFRGDQDFFAEGLNMINRICKKPIMGLVPYIDVDIDDEDSLSERLRKKSDKLIDIAVIKLPKMSNFTDFNMIDSVNIMGVRYISRANELGEPDMIIIPGTKNTVDDLRFMRENGFELLIKRYINNGGIVFGICGGYQMMGDMVYDDCDAEGGKSIKGMGIFNTTTKFKPKKVCRQVSGRFSALKGALSGLSGIAFKGYEIHMGQSDDAPVPLSFIAEADDNLRSDGSNYKNCYGTYVHGIFDSEQVLMALAEALLKRKGLEMSGFKLSSSDAYRKMQYDILADAVRQSIDMKKVYSILERGV